MYNRHLIIEYFCIIRKFIYFKRLVTVSESNIVVTIKPDYMLDQ